MLATYTKFLLIFLLIASVLSYPPNAENGNTNQESSKLDDIFVASLHVDVLNVSTQQTIPTKICGGSILTEKWILTAGHCIDQMETTGKEGHVMVNVSDDETQNQKVKVRKGFKHPEYVSGNSLHDIALACLEKPLVFNNSVQSIDLPNENDDPNGSGFIISSVDEKSSNDSQSKHFMAMNVSVLANPECLKYYEFFNDSYVCVGGDGKSACGGDSGGPFVQEHNGQKFVSGVDVLAKSLCGPSYPSAFIRVASHVAWIKQTMEKEAC